MESTVTNPELKYRIYKDSKEIPYRIFERIETTGDFFYMVKGYDQDRDIELELEDLKEKYDEILQDFIMSINAKNQNIQEKGKIIEAQNEILQLYCILEAINLKIIRDSIQKTDNEIIFKFLSKIKIPKSDDLDKIKKTIEERISNYETQITESKLIIEEGKSTQEKMDPNMIFIYVENGLERSLDMDKVTLYQFGILQDLVVKKFEQLNKIRNVR